jgi:ferredoxin
VFKFRLAARECICCGICVDCCKPGALQARTVRGGGVEGNLLIELETFPYFARPSACDGCMQCVRECPPGALAIT